MLRYTTEESLSGSEVSEDEYVPQSAQETEIYSSAKGDCSAEDEEEQHKKGKKRKVQKTTSANSQEGDVHVHKRWWESGEFSSSGSYDVMVMMLKKKECGDRLYNKKFNCVFCFKPFSKMARHLESKHKDKPEVARAITFPKGSKE